MLLHVPDEFSLQLAARNLNKHGIAYRAFAEPDLDGQTTALATEPLRGDARKHFRKYRLLEA